MKKDVYLKILLAPLTALVFSACSPSLYNQPQEYDDIYFTSADRKKAPVIQETISQPRLVEKEKVDEVEKTYTTEEYSREYVDPEILEKYNNGNQKVAERFSDDQIRVSDPRFLNYEDFLVDLDNGYLENTDLPLEWGSGYWSEVQFNNRLDSDLQFRNAWYDYYYRGYDGSLTNYYDRFQNNSDFTSYISYNVIPVFRPRPRLRVRLGLGFGFGWNRFYDPFYSVGFGWNRFYDPFYDPFFDPFYFGSAFWCPPIYNRWDPFFGNRIYGSSYARLVNRNYILDGSGTRSSRDIQRGPRVTRSSIASVRSEASNGTAAPRSRSQAYIDANGSPTSRRGGRAVASNNVQTNRSSRNAALNTGTRSRSSQVGSRSAVTANSTGRVRSGQYNSRANSRSSSEVRSRSSRNAATSSRSRSNYSSRSSSSRGAISGSRPNLNRGSRSSRPTFSRGSSSRSSSSRSISRGSSSRSSGASRSGSVSRGSSSRSSGSVSRGSSRSSSSSRSGSSRSGSSRGGSSRGKN